MLRQQKQQRNHCSALPPSLAARASALSSRPPEENEWLEREKVGLRLQTCVRVGIFKERKVRRKKLQALCYYPVVVLLLLHGYGLVPLAETDYTPQLSCLTKWWVQQMPSANSGRVFPVFFLLDGVMSESVSIEGQGGDDEHLSASPRGSASMDGWGKALWCGGCVSREREGASI